MEAKRYFKPKLEPAAEIRRNLKRGFGGPHLRGLGNLRKVMKPNRGKLRMMSLPRRFF